MTRNKTYKVLVTPKADAMALEHARFLAKVNGNAARKLITEYQAALRSLRENPERFPWLDHISEITPYKYRKLLFGKRYLLLFNVLKEGIVSVEAVVDCRQDYGDDVAQETTH
jgi:plasmid stabilization system protein ParE